MTTALSPRAARLAFRAERIRRRQRRPRPLVQYQHDPIAFAVAELGIPERTIRWSLNDGYGDHAWDGTPDPLARLVESLAEGRSAGAESGTGTGKSFELGWVYLWFLACWEGARVFTFAPKEDQLRLYSWMELGKLWPRFERLFPMAQLTDLRIRMVPGSDEWGAWGYPVAVRAGQQVAVHAAGMHAPHMLLVYEESPGISPAVIQAGIETCTSPHNLRLYVGNPDHQFDALHQACLKPDVVHVRISAEDHPNVVTGAEIVPGAVSLESLERRYPTPASRTSRLYQSRVRGISPAESSEALVRLSWVRAAVARYDDPALRLGPKALGVDVANSADGDPAAIARGVGRCLVSVSAFACPNSVKLGDQLKLEMALEDISPRHVGVDSVGVGAGTVGRLKSLGQMVQALNGGERAVPETWNPEGRDDEQRRVTEEEVYQNLRAQMWWQMRRDLEAGLIALPDDAELHEELIAVEWMVAGGRIVVESKERPLAHSKQTASLSQRLGRSPNKADAAVYWNWVRLRGELAEPPDGQRSAWDPEIIAHEALEGRRARTRTLDRDGLVDPQFGAWLP